MAISQIQKNIIKKTSQRFQPTLIGIFGSYARGEQNESSDLDILIDFYETINLIELIGIEQELSDLLGVKVDLVTLKSVHPSLKPYIDSDLIRIL
jgi:predicted nucleotidyltransferase